MGWLDRVPGDDKLYIGGLYALRKREVLKEAGISHVVSVLRWPLDEQLVKPYKHLQIDVDDEDEENLLEFFPTSNRFIGDALSAGGSVFVHCAMGKSRSATIVIAYLMQKYHMPPMEALFKLRESRGVCEPNLGFMKQLRLFHTMQTPSDVESDPAYQRWLYQRELDLSRACKQAPGADKIRFEDEHSRTVSDAVLHLKCRKCRRTLANSHYFVEHAPRQIRGGPEAEGSPPVPPSACAHYFLDALSWMRPELEQGKLEGRLECPKCRSNVGKYAWQGMQCSCGDWVIPGISLAKGRVDQIRSKSTCGSPASETATATATVDEGVEVDGIRYPPPSVPSGRERERGGCGNL